MRRRVPDSPLWRFHCAASDASAGETWPQIRRRLGHEVGLVNDHGRAKSAACARFLRKCRAAWLAGRAFRRLLKASASKASLVKRRTKTRRKGAK